MPPKGNKSTAAKKAAENPSQTASRTPPNKLVKRRGDSDASAVDGVTQRSGGSSARRRNRVKDDAGQKAQGTKRQGQYFEPDSRVPGRIVQETSETSGSGGDQVIDAAEKSMDIENEESSAPAGADTTKPRALSRTNTLGSISESEVKSEYDSQPRNIKPISRQNSRPSLDEKTTDIENKSKDNARRKSSIPQSESSKERALVPKRNSIPTEPIESNPPAITSKQRELVRGLNRTESDENKRQSTTIHSAYAESVTYPTEPKSEDQVSPKRTSVSEKPVERETLTTTGVQEKLAKDSVEPKNDGQVIPKTTSTSKESIESQPTTITSTQTESIRESIEPKDEGQVEVKVGVQAQARVAVKENSKSPSYRNWGGRGYWNNNTSSDNFGKAERRKPVKGRVSDIVARFERLGSPDSSENNSPGPKSSPGVRGSPSLRK